VFIPVGGLDVEHGDVTWESIEEVMVVERSFEEFFEVEQERILRLVWLVTGSRQEAEDIVQDAFLRV
jgi:DNA-directed RNA polymerase specialized sigma24 family protein